MDDNHDIIITIRDRLLMAWENSMELTRDFKVYSHEIKNDDDVAKTFSKFAEDEGMHASKLRELLQKYQDQ